MARFISWHIQLLSGATPKILQPSTLKEMQRLQWISSDKRLTWALGFNIHEYKGITDLGHDGSCPGYRSIVQMDPKKNWGLSCCSMRRAWTSTNTAMPSSTYV